MIYDLIVVGNGLAAQTFLFELYKKLDVNKSQNFLVAQIYSEEIAASCSVRSTASVSLNGTEEGISPLGDELRDSFFLFQEFLEKYNPVGVEKVKQLVTYSTDKKKEKMLRRYKKLGKINHPLLNAEINGVELDSYLISPELFKQWFEDQLSPYKILQKKDFLKKMTKNSEGIIECELLDSEVLKTKKIVLCTGAYAQLFSSFFQETQYTDELKKTQIIAGNFLERSGDLNRPSFYFTIDEKNLIYRNAEKKLIIGSASKNGGIIMADHTELNEIISLFNQKCNFPLGESGDFKIVTGLRHKGIRRRPIAQALDVEKTIFMINGLYKNGFTFSHLCAKKVLEDF